MSKKRIYFGNDHAVYEVKDEIINYLNSLGYEVVDLGAKTEDGRVDYSKYAIEVGEAVAQDEQGEGILLCGTGIGMSIAANKVPGVRAAVAYNDSSATLAKEHNKANIIALGVREHSVDEIKKMLKSYLEASFAGGRHINRIAIIDDYEQNKK
ncbi:ribose 5-phosphate isomerase B [Ureaplasma sp. ES3154-GEN]|uniref:ribose 5-phosphate isomerase B n=1 Tax=Ureaplasma sp. ES3154-GEN TaxID=2984844 RepID=UPI0021E7338B|nr:ribose 5-phosphate isomerase B [Ureaplasma sp. ES3154-GEN]MCV3743754.1 ribose 5-phosphate isomerase B [Ureaplasma sp. ES3154-GEN]